MHPFEVLSEPIRRRIVEILALGEHTAGTIETIICIEFGVTRAAVQHHLAYFKKNGWVDVRPELNERWYRLEDDAILELKDEVQALLDLWHQRYGAIERRDMPMPKYKDPRPSQPSKKGRRGHGMDPDDPWIRGWTSNLHEPIEGGGGEPPRVSYGYA